MPEPSPPANPPPEPSGRDRDDALASTLHELRSRGPDLIFRVALVVTFFVLVWSMLMPVVLGGLSAIVLSPMRDRIEKRLGRASRLAPGVVTGVTLLGFLLPLSWVAWSSMLALNHFLGTTFGHGFEATRARLSGMLTSMLGPSIAEASLTKAVEEGTQRVATFLTGWLGNLAAALPEAITNLFLFVLALYFALRDGPRLVQWGVRVSPVSPRRTGDLFAAIRLSVNGTMIGMLVVALVQGGLALIALLVCRVPNPFLWGFVASIVSALPIVGTTPVTMGSAVWLFLQDRPVAAIGMVVAALVIGVSDNVVRPWVLSSHDDMHPLVALLAIFGGLALFGPSGLLLGPVIASMAVWAVETYRDEPRSVELAPLTASPTEPGTPS